MYQQSVNFSEEGLWRDFSTEERTVGNTAHSQAYAVLENLKQIIDDFQRLDRGSFSISNSQSEWLNLITERASSLTEHLKQGTDIEHPRADSVIYQSRIVYHDLVGRMGGIIRAFPQQELEPETLRQRQLILLNQYLDFARTHSDYWRSRLPHAPLRTYEEVLELPTTTKRDILEHHTIPLMERLKAQSPPTEIQTPMMTVPLAGCEIWRTSSSTGLPTVLARLPEEMELFGEITARYLRRWFTTEHTVANLDHAAGGWPGILFGKLIPNIIGSACEFLGNSESDEYLLTEFIRFQFNSAIGTPSWFAQFMSRLEKSGRIDDFPQLDLFCFGGEPATAFVETSHGELERLPRYLEKRFGTKMLSVYSGTEIGLAGTPLTEEQRANEHFTAIDDGGFLEFITDSGEQARCGDDCQLFVTGFGNVVVPLVRFQSGDAVRLLSEANAEGYGSRIFSFSPNGTRLDDTIVTAGGKLYGAGVIVDRLAEQLKTPCQLLVRNASRSGEIKLVVRSERALHRGEELQADKTLREELFRLEPSERNKPVVEGASVTFEQGLEYTSTTKLRKIIQWHS